MKYSDGETEDMTFTELLCRRNLHSYIDKLEENYFQAGGGLDETESLIELKVSQRCKEKALTLP